MSMRVLTLALLLISNISLANSDQLGGQTKLPQEYVGIAKHIHKLMKKYAIPSASLAVVYHGEIVWADAFGDAHLNPKLAATTNTYYQAASITKTLTAAALIKLLDSKKISLDTPVNQILKRWKIPENKFTTQSPVTIRMLLNHTAGISNPYPDGGYGRNQALPTLTQLFEGKRPATNQPLKVEYLPGSHFKYCNGCYAILQMAMEDLSGMTYPQLMRQLVFKPLAMSHSTFSNAMYSTHFRTIALPYDEQNQLFAGAPLVSPIFATGYLWSTPTDLAKFIIIVQKSILEGTEFLTKQQAMLLIKPDGSESHGLGFFLADKFANEKKNGKFFMHSGSNVGYLTLLIGGIRQKVGVVIFINKSPQWDAKEFPQFDFVKEIEHMVANQDKWES